jgi:predicted  nucleic acid-binding Zn-ribbon protein
MPAPTAPVSSPRPVSPGIRPKQKKSNLPIILSVVAAVFAGAAGYLFTQLNARSTELMAAKDGLVKLAEAAGSGALAPEDLIDPDGITSAIDKLSGDVGTLVQNGQSARAEVDRQRVQIADQSAQIEASRVQLGSVQGRLKEATDDLGNARAEAEKARNDMADLQRQYGEEVSGLNDRIAELTAALAATTQEGDGASVDGEMEIAAVAEPVQRVLKRDIANGDSRLFSSISYDTGKRSLTFKGLNGESLSYSNVPADVYDGLASAPVVDIFFRFQILERFEANTSDIDFVRAQAN